MNVLRRTIAGVLLGVTATVVAAPISEASGRCIEVMATGTGQDLGNFQTVADIFVGPVRIGSTAATFTPTGQVGPVVSFTGPITFTARFGLGTFRIDSAGTVDITTGAFRSSGPVRGGTGIFRGVSGELVLTGVQDLATGRFAETITGQLCAGRDLAVAVAPR